MKKTMIFMFLIILFAFKVHALMPVATGTVTQANMKLSVVSGTAFVDFSLADSLTPYVGYKIVITDSSSKNLTGYIKAVGTGETYNELITNGNCEAGAFAGTGTSGLTSNAQSTEQVHGGTYSAKLTFDTSTGHSVNVAASGKLLLLDVWMYVPSAQSITGNIGVYDVSAGSWFLVSSTKDTWVHVANGHYRVGTIGLGSTMGTADGKYMFFDDVSAKQVLTPSSTGVIIVTAYGGSTYNWTSEDSGFKRNDTSYTYAIYPGAVNTTISDTNTHSYVLVDCADAAGTLGIDVTGAATIQNYTVVRCPAGGFQFEESATLKNTVAVSTGNDITIAATKTVSGTSNLFNDAAKAGSGTYTDVAGTQWNKDPLFKSSTDYRLKSSSPCKNAGVDVGLTTDILGKPIRGLPDIGAYELQPLTGGGGFGGYGFGFGF